MRLKRSAEVAERVYQVGGPGFSDSSDCCVYLVDGNASLVLIDAGCGRNPERIADNIRKLGFQPEQVETIIATHGHIDHVGGLAWLAEKLQAKTAAHRLELPAIQDGRPELTAAAMYGVHYRPVAVDLVLDGEKSEVAAGEITLCCLHTPGHTPGGISVYADINGTRVLFGQDILCEGHFGLYFPASEVERYIRSYLDRPGGLL
ncbi:MAG: MBL fold metallo-hydrolase [Solirubrobacterales bacterium]